MRVCIWRRDRAEAQRMMQNLDAGLQAFPHVLRLLQAVATGERLDLVKLLSDMPLGRSSSGRGQALFHQLGCEWYSFQGEFDQAIKALAPAVDNGLCDIVWMDLCPLLQPLHKDPRFAAMRRSVEARAKKVRDALTQPLL
jgi:serine/threonine-protein kinase